MGNMVGDTRTIVDDKQEIDRDEGLISWSIQATLVDKQHGAGMGGMLWDIGDTVGQFELVQGGGKLR